MKTSLIYVLAMMTVALALPSCDEDETPDFPSRMMVRSLGTDTAAPVTRTLPGSGQEVSGTAFVLDIFDEASGTKIGTLTDLTVQEELLEDGTMKAETYTFFDFSADQSVLVMHGFIDMVAIEGPIWSARITPENAEDNVVGGTGRFDGVRGSCTLDATLDLTAFAEGTIGFDCLYDFHLE